MSVHVSIAPRASRNIQDIFLYSDETWGTLVATQYIDDIFRAIDRLSDNPQLGKVIRNGSDVVHYVRVRRHVVYYRLNGESLRVIRVLHERQQARADLFDQDD